MIVLDSNQLRQVAAADDPLLNLLRKLSDATDRPLAIPQIVLDEHLGYQGHEVQAALPRCRSPRATSPSWRRGHLEQNASPERGERRDGLQAGHHRSIDTGWVHRVDPDVIVGELVGQRPADPDQRMLSGRTCKFVGGQAQAVGSLR